MNKRSIIIIVAIAAIMLAIIVYLPVVKDNFLIGTEPKFSGTRTRNTETDAFEMVFEVFNTSDSESFDLEAGDELKVSWNIAKGSVTLYVMDENQKEVYRADDRQAKDKADFTLVISERGKYTVHFIGKKATGSINIERK